MSMKLSNIERERLEKRDVVDLLELEVRELEVRLKLRRLKAELVGRDTRSLRTIFIDEMKDAIAEKNGNIPELKKLALVYEEVLGDEVPDLPTLIDELVDPPKAELDRTTVDKGVGFERLKQSADILCELLDFTPGTEEEIFRKVEEFSCDTEWQRN